jgi:hypothetical protein
MKLHANAPLGPKGRAVMARRAVEGVRTAGKWARRYRAEGEAGMVDRSSAPGTVHNATPLDRVEAIGRAEASAAHGP